MKKALKSLVLTFMFLTSMHMAIAQPEGVKFGKIPKEELQMSSYESDPEAVAVVLYDVGSTHFNFNKESGFQTIYERETRIKILRKEGYEFANVSIPFYVSSRGDEVVSGIKASTYNLENGKEDEIKMEKKAIFEEQINKHWKLMKFTLPNVREGSVIEYKYQITSDFVFSPPKWEFQWDIPVVWSEYSFSSPEYYRYVQLGQGYDPYEVAETEQRSRTISFLSTRNTGNDYVVNKQTQSNNVNYTEYGWHWVQKDLAAHKEEPYSPAREDLISKIEFQLASVNVPGSVSENVVPNWEQLAQDLIADEDFGRYLRKGNKVDDIVASATAGASTPEEKVIAIQDYVKSNFRWNENRQIYASQSMNDLLKSRVGNSADLNLLLVLLLREVGVEAYPVVISTRDHGRINQAYPLISKFNSVIAYAVIGDEGFTMDATAPTVAYNMVAYQDLNGEGLLVSEDGYAWVIPGKDFKEMSFNNVSATLEDGKLVCNIAATHRGYVASELRKALKANGESEIAERYLKSYFEEVDVKQSSFEHKNDYNESLKSNFEFESSAFVENAGALVYINPMLGFGLDENPFKKPERAFPVDFAHASDDIYQLIFTVPEGYTVAEAPEPIRMAMEDGSLKFDYLVAQNGNQVRLNYRLTRNRVMFSPEEYVHLRAFYEEIAKHCNNQLVLKKL